jgi:hypothetical protein
MRYCKIPQIFLRREFPFSVPGPGLQCIAGTALEAGVAHGEATEIEQGTPPHEISPEIHYPVIRCACIPVGTMHISSDFRACTTPAMLDWKSSEVPDIPE